MATLSPLAPKTFVSLEPLAGIRLASHACGLRYQGRTDLMVAELAPGTTAAGVFTTSKTASAPVIWCRGVAKGGRARAIVANAGNANAFTGKAGVATVTAVAKMRDGTFRQDSIELLVTLAACIDD